MRWVWQMAVCLGCCLAGLGALPVAALGEGQSPEGSSTAAGGTGASSSLSGSLVTAGSPVAGEESQTAHEAELASPEAVAARESSRTRYQNEDQTQASQTLAETFPAVVDKQDGGPPPLEAGEASLGFKSANVEQITMGSGYVGLVQSTAPMAVPTGGGQYAAVDLAPQQAGGGFEAQRPLVTVHIPKHLGEGAQIPQVGVSLTPVDASGSPLSGSEGVTDGMGVLFANTQTDTDTLLKPSLTGIDASTILRSIESPEALYYSVGMPQGARLVASSNGGAEVVDEGAVIATVKSPMATDAAGTVVPVSTSVSGDTLVVSMKHDEGSYQYPILLDPELSGYWQEWSNVVSGNWEFHELIGYTYEIAGAELRMKHEPGSFEGNDYAIWSEKAQGYTKIFDVYVKDELYPWSSPEGKVRDTPSWLDAWMETYKPGGGGEEENELTGSPYRSEATVCGGGGCDSAEGTPEGNGFEFGLTTREGGTTGEQFYAHAEQVSTGFAQQYGKHSTVEYMTSGDVEGEENVLAGGGKWIGPHTKDKLEYTSKDGGLGVDESWIEVKEPGGWEKVQNTEFLSSVSCKGIQCHEGEYEVASYKSLTDEDAKPLPEPEAHIRVSAKSYMPYSSSNEHGEGETVLKVDAKPPHSLTVSGLATKGEELELGEVEAHLKVEAADGEGSTPSSGVQWIGVEIDGHKIGSEEGYCSPGPCTASHEWSINGAELGVGRHTLKVVAADNAGNISEPKEYVLNVYSSSPVAMGPGSVNPESGDFALEASDVDLSGGTGSLSVTRHYDSLNPKEGEEGPLGPQWTIGLGSLSSLEVLPDKSVMVVGPDGLTHFSVKTGGGFEAPEGDKNLILEYESKTPAYLLKNLKEGTTTEFTLPTGAQSWMPTISKGPVATDTTTDTYRTEEVEGKKIVEPTLELAPHPSASCEPKKTRTEKTKMEKGCRALEFVYAEKTKESIGEAETEWGEYKGRLKEVIAIAYNPSTKEMGEAPVARYEYDKQGRLRAEWDPRIETSDACTTSCQALKTTYGYDAEGHITALTPPGQQPWTFSYGTIAGDSVTGRLLKVTRAHPQAGWSETKVAEKLHELALAPKNTEAPKIAGSPATGIRLAVSNGIWSESPVVYGYQWEDCNSSGKECSSILGATNANYTPVSSDVGHTLVAEVTGSNGWGSVEVSSAASAVVKSGSSYGFNAVSCVHETTTCVVSSSAGSALYATNVSDSSAASWKEWSGPSGQSPSQAVDCPTTGLCLLADGKETAGGKLYYATSLGGAFSEAYGPSYGVDAISCVSSSFCVDGQDGEGYFRYATSPASTSWILEEQGSAAMKGVFCLSSSFCAIADSKGDVHIATSTSQIESSSWKETDIDGSTGLNGVACTSTTSCVAVDGSGNALKLTIESSGVATASKHDIDGTTSLTAVTCTGSSTCVAVDSKGNVFIPKNSGETWTKEYSLSDDLTSVSCASSSLCVAPDTSGKIAAFNLSGTIELTSEAEGEAQSAQPGSTIEYGVPVSGTGAPHEMGTKGVEAWAQKDDPTYATAVFAADEPMGWPATDYRRATVYYMDSEARTVNAASPTGGITTTEYNERNEVKRTLSADNRAAAVKEGSKSAEVSDKLDTKTEYEPEGSNIVKVIGPEHKVKLSSGEEVEARPVTHDYYNEGAKEAEEKNKETYNLVTKSTSGALLTNGEEKDRRETITSYNGQEDLGWKLRKPTSVTKEPGGLNLTTTTVYQENENAKKEKESTGAVVETRSAKGSVSGSPIAPVFASVFGSEGKGEGQFTYLTSMAFDVSGNVWVVDSGNDRVQKFSSEGSYLSAFGSKGTGAGQFEEPWGVAINKNTGNIYVTDSSNNRVQEFSSTGAFVRTWGFGVSDGKSEFEVCTSGCKAGVVGSGSGQFSDPIGIGVDGSGNVWVADGSNSRVEEFSAEGAYLKKVGSKGSGNLQFKEPNGLTFSGKNLYVSDYGNSRIEELSGSGAYIRTFGGKGSGNGQFDATYGVAADPVSGNLYVADAGNNRVQEFTTTGTFVTKFGSEGSGNGQFDGPLGVAVNSEGGIYVGDFGHSRVEEFEPVPSAPAYTAKIGSVGSGNGQFKEPKGVDIAKNGNLFVLDSSNSRVQELSPSGTYLNKFGSSGTGSGQMKGPYGMAVDAKGDVWVADTGNDRVDEFNEKREFVQAFGWGVSNGEEKLEVCTSTCQAGIAGSGTGQFKEMKGIAVAPNGNVYVGDTPNNRVEEFTEKGEFIAAFGFGVTNEKAEFEICTKECKAGTAGSGNGQFNGPIGIVVAPDGDVWVTDRSNNRVEEFNEKDGYVSKFGTVGSGSGQLKEPKGIAIDAAGNLWVADTLNNRVQEFTPSGTFLTMLADKGTGNAQLEEPWGITLAAGGAVYVADLKNNRVQEWARAPRPGNEGAHDTKTAYYSAGTESEVSSCRNRPEWANLPCQTEPAAQPATGVSPELPVKTIAYNMWDQAEKMTETFGSGEHKVERKKKTTFDSAGRPMTTEETSLLAAESSEEPDKSLPKVTDEYNAETGAVEKQSTSEGTVTSKYDTLAQLVEYEDAGGNVAKYAYEEGGDARLDEVSEGKGEEADSYQTYSYNTTTGLMEKLVDSAAGTFTASYDVEGEMTSEVYPNGMCANTTYNSVGEATSLEYIKTRNCSETGAAVWFSDSIVPSIHGETLQQTSTLSKENYAYDNAGRLLETQETPVGEGCDTRLYAYDEEGDRTSLTTRESATETCATEGGIVQGHAYDSANRLTDDGIEYETFGNTTKLPAADAGTGEGAHELKSTYYIDGQVATQEQSEKMLAYTYDPAGRTETTETKIKGKLESTAVSHYAGSGSALTWTSEGSSKWTRDIPGIDGGLDAIQTSSGSPVLQLHDLNGDIVGTASLSESETKLLSTYNSTEFGVPVGGKEPPKYSWLGADGVTSELPSGETVQDGVTYVPLTGAPLQTQPVEIPLPIKYYEPYEKPNAEGATWGPASAALRVAEYWEAKRKAEEADQCHEEEAYCGPDPESGDNIDQCKVGAKVWAIPDGEVGYEGRYHCEYVNVFELQVVLWEQQSNGEYKEVHKSGLKEVFHDAFDGSGASLAKDWNCEPGHVFLAWAWGRYWHGFGGATIWAGDRTALHSATCEGSPPDGPDLPPDDS